MWDRGDAGDGSAGDPGVPAQTVSATEQIRSAAERAEAFKKQVKLPQAVREYEQALDLARQHLGPEDMNTAEVMGYLGYRLANLYQAMGRYAEAEPLYRRSLAILEKQLGPDHPDVAASLNSLASLYQAMGRYAEAEPLYRRSLAIEEKQLGRDHPDVATSLNNLAALYHAMGRYAEAEPLFRRSLEIREKQLGATTPTWPEPEQPGGPVPGHGPVRRGRAAVPPQPGDPGEAARARPPRRGTEPEQPGGLYHAMGRYAEAEPLYRRSLEIREKQLGRDHPDVAQSLNNLADLYYAMGRYAEAEPLFRRSLAIGEKQLGATTPTWPSA